MQTRQLGRNGPSISALGLGCMGFSGGYGPVDDRESIATVHAALDAGVNYLDTGDFYGAGQNEMLLGQALKGRREKAFIAVKFGALRSPDGTWLGSGQPPGFGEELSRLFAQAARHRHHRSLSAARIDPAVADRGHGRRDRRHGQGWLRAPHRLSEAGTDAIRRAHKVHPIAALQIEYSLMSRGVEKAILPVLRELGISLVAYGVLSRGLIADHALSGSTGGEIRSRMPRFMGDISRAIARWSRRCRRSPRRRAARPPSSRSPGWRRAGATSFHSSAPSARCSWPAR